MPKPYPLDMLPTLYNEDLINKKFPFYALGMLVVSEYSQVEVKISHLLTAMLGANPLPATTIYGLLRSAQMQKTAISAIAKDALPLEDFDRFKSILPLIKEASDYRDELAHRLWFGDDKLPEAIVLHDPTNMWRMDVSIRQINAKGTPSTEEALKLQDAMRAGSNVWTRKDFETARLACVHANVGIAIITEIMNAPMGSVERASAREKLVNLLSAAKPKPDKKKAR
jgi:hypothetical protein